MVGWLFYVLVFGIWPLPHAGEAAAWGGRPKNMITLPPPAGAVAAGSGAAPQDKIMLSSPAGEAAAGSGAARAQ